MILRRERGEGRGCAVSGHWRGRDGPAGKSAFPALMRVFYL
jgi:hypothetical protein